MGIKRSLDLTRTIARAARDATGAEARLVETGAMPAEISRDEPSVAPVIGATARLRYSPLVEGTLTLSSGQTVYEEGLDYEQTPEGFTNFAIPEGTPLEATYFYHGEGPIPDAGGTQGPGQSSGSAVGGTSGAAAPRYATLMKLGTGG